MPFVSYKTKENTKKCQNCKVNILTNYKTDSKGYLNILALDDKLGTVTAGLRWAACKVCPIEKDFEKVYGTTPMKYFS